MSGVSAMALRKCQECGRQVSTRAKRCPGCGNPYPTRTDAQRLIVMGALIVFLLFVGPIIGGLSKILGPVIDNHIKGSIEAAKKTQR
jgi:hypothetical protein